MQSKAYAVLIAVLTVQYTSVTAFQCPDLSPCECRREKSFTNDKDITYNVIECEGSFDDVRVNFSAIGNTLVKTLTLTNSSLTRIDVKTFKGLKVETVKIINSNAIFSSNAFQPIKDTLRHLSLTRIRTISTSKRWKLPFLKGLSDLKSLELDGNGEFPLIFPEYVFRNLSLFSLKSLSLRHCEIANIAEDAFEGLDNLEVLDLSHNKITSTPTAILLLKNLRKFIMTHNDLLTYIHNDAFASLNSLTEINLGHSKIKTIQDQAFNGLEECLVQLKLNHGALQNGHFSSMKALKRLKKLDIAYNRIIEMHNSSFVGFYGLEYLDISGQEDGDDRLVLVDAVFRGIEKSLRTLKIRDSGMDETLPLAPLSSLNRLKVLDVSKNDFTEVGESFFDGVRARKIYMTDMEITDISSEAFETLMPNVEIIFDRNNITNISFILDTKLCAFSKLSFLENPIICDCDVVEIAATNRVDNLIGTCADSFYLQNKLRHLHEVEITKQTCGDHKYEKITHCFDLNSATIYSGVVFLYTSLAFAVIAL